MAYNFSFDFTLRLYEESESGSQRRTSGRRRGRHEQMMPTFVSTELQVAAGGLSYVGSEEFDMATSD